ncbi:hypothetical protein MY10362_005520 [Beauveria mimosiformis]
MTRIAASFCLSRNSGIYEMTLKMGLKIWNQQDLAAHKDNYTRVFGAAVLFEDADSCSVRFNNVISEPAPRQRRGRARREERFVARPDAGNRCQLLVWVADVDAEVARVKAKGVATPLEASPLAVQ